MEIRDQVRRAYLTRGPCQPKSHNFPRIVKGRDERGFIINWFDKFEWLEYSVHKEASFCFYCYLFKKSRTRGVKSSDAFTN